MQDRIKQMAVEAGGTTDWSEHEVCNIQPTDYVFTAAELERFAQAVARECCQIVDSEMDKADCALLTAPSDAIRARFGLGE